MIDPFDPTLPPVVALSEARKRKGPSTATHDARGFILHTNKLLASMHDPEQYGDMLEGQTYSLACFAHETAIPLETVVAALRMEYNVEAERRAQEK